MGVIQDKSMTCRVCGSDLFDDPIFILENMPTSAQDFGKTRNSSLEHCGKIDLEICQCSRCELVQLNNDPVLYYKNVIRAVAFSKEMKRFREVQFKDFVSSHSLQGKKILEVGCGRGEYLHLMRDTGANVYGIEHATDSVYTCVRSDLLVEKLYIDRSDIEIPHAPFDAFFTMNFFVNVLFQFHNQDMKNYISCFNYFLALWTAIKNIQSF